MDAVIFWIEGVKAGAANFKSEDQVHSKQAGELVDENLTVLIDALACIVDSNKLHKLYMQILNIVQRIVMSVPVRNNNDKSQIESNTFRISQECRERTLLLCCEMAMQDNQYRSQNQANQQLAPLDEMTQIKMLQIIMIFLDSNHSDKLSKNFVNLVIKTCFQLFEQKQQKGGLSVAVKSTIQATLKQLFSLIIENFIQQVECTVGKQNLAIQQEQIAQIFLEKQDEINKLQIVNIVQDNLQNLATALFINEKYTFSQDVGLAFVNYKAFLKKQSQNENKIEGLNQHIWNFKPSTQAFCSVLEIIIFFLEQTQSLSVYFPKLNDILKNQICPTLSRIQKYFNVNEYIGGNLGIRIVKCLVTITNSFQGQSIENIKQVDIQNTEELIILVSQMADLNSIIPLLKEKEINQQTVIQIFQKMNWRHIAGMEAIATLLQNQNLVGLLFYAENLRVAMSCLLEVMKNNLHFISLLDQKNIQSMINSQQDFIILQSYQSTQSNSKKLENLSTDQNMLINQIKSQKYLIDQKSQQASDDDFGPTQNQQFFKNFMSPLQLQLLLQESVFNLINSLKMIEQQEIQLPNFEVKGQINLGKEQTLVQENLINNSQNQLQRQNSKNYKINDLNMKQLALSKFSIYLNDILQKIHISIQRNQIHMDQQNFKIEKLIMNKELGKLSFKQQMLLNKYNSFINQITMLQSIEQLIEIFQNENLFQQRDCMVGILCQQSFSQEISLFNRSNETYQAVFTLSNYASFLSLSKIIDFNFQLKKKQNFDDSIMWSLILETLLRIDSILLGLLENLQNKNYDSRGSDTNTKIDPKKNVQQTKIWVVDSQKNKVEFQNETNKIVLNYILEKDEMEHFQNEINSIYENSLHANKNQFYQFIESFKHLIKEYIANKNAQFTNNDLKQNSFIVLLVKRLFQIIQINFSRIHFVWVIFQNIMEIIIAVDRSSFLKTFVIDQVQNLILQYFQFQKNQKQLQSSVKDIQSEILEIQIQDLSPDFQDDINKKKDQESSESDSLLEDDKWIQNNWQQTIFEIFSKTMKSNNSNDKLYVLKSIDKIIQLQGQSFCNEGWRVIIINLNNASGEIDNHGFIVEAKVQTFESQKLLQQVYQNGLKCLKFILNNYIDNIGHQNLISILNCVKDYVQSPNSENINSNLSAIGMFMNFADYIARVSKSEETMEKQNRNLEEIWENLFNRILVILQDKRSEIRRSSIQILEDIIINHGKSMSIVTWNLLMQKTLIEMLQYSSKQFHLSSTIVQKKAQETIETPSSKQLFTQRKKMDFDDESVMKALQDNDDNSWSETCIQLISSIYRAMKIYLQVISKIEEDSNFSDKIWMLFNSILAQLIQDGKDVKNPEFQKTISQIILQIFSSQDDFLALQTSQDDRNNCTLFILSKFKYQYTLYENIQTWIAQQNIIFQQDIIKSQESKNNQLNKTKSLVLKVIPILVQSLITFVNKNTKELSNNDKYLKYQDQFINPKFVETIIDLLDNLLIGCQIIADGFKQYQNEDLQNKCFKLCIEEHQILNLFENLVALISDYEKAIRETEINQNVKTCQELLINYFIFKMQYKGTAHSESITKFITQMVSTIILKNQISFQILKANCLNQNSFLNQLQKLINIRYNWQMSRNLIQQYGSQNSQLFSIQQILTQLQNKTFQEINLNIDPMSINIIHFSLLHLIIISKYILSSEELLEKCQNFNQLKISSNLPLLSINWLLKDSNQIQVQQFDDDFKINILTYLVQGLKNELIFDLKKFDQDGNKINFESKNEVELNQKDEVHFIELINICQVVDILSVGFITNDLVPAYSKLYFENELEKTIIQIVDNGCNAQAGGFGNGSGQIYSSNYIKFFRSSNVLQSKYLSQAQAQISLFSIQNLFQICKSAETVQDIQQKKVLCQLKKQILPIIIQRCEEILKKFIQDEQRSGSIKLQQSRIQEVIFILKEIQNIQANEENLISVLMPILSEMIVSQSDEIRQNLKIIFSAKNSN